MPVQKCQVGGKSGYKFGPSGKCFTGPGARSKAAAQGRAIQASRRTSNLGTDMETITFNLTGPARHDTMEGRDYLVVPMVMLTEGVHAGSKGPMYYPKDELAKTPQVWNHKPITVYHPQEGQSACDPIVLDASGVGMIMNAHFDDKLRAEAWFEQHRLDKIDDRISEALEKNELMEVSTGLYTDHDLTEGEFNGEPYSIIARNYRPDHLAVLPDQTGSCSIEDGAGLLQTNTLHDPMSHDNIRQNLNRAIEEKFGDNDPITHDVWVVDVFLEFFIFHRDNKLWQLGYMHDLTTVTLADEQPTEVVRVAEFRTVNGDFVGNEITAKKFGVTNERKEPVMDKEQIVANLIENKATQWTEEDRDHLAGLDEKLLLKMDPVENKKPDPPTTPAKTETVEIVENSKDDQGDAPKVPTCEEYVQNAPPEYRNVLIAGLASHNRERAEWVKTITTNATDIYTVEQLNDMGSDELAKLASLVKAVAPAPDPTENGRRDPLFHGAAGPTDNTGGEEKPLGLPTLNYETASA